MAVVVTTEPRGFHVYQSNEIGRSMRSALLLGAATAAAISIAQPAAAQDQTVETVVVTGSRIPQQGLYSSSPVTAVGQQEMQLQGTTNVSTLLNNLPSVFAGQTSFTGNASSGTATVDLRNLGASRTLVMIDGKRMGPGDPVVPVPDLNQIPAAMVDHVEVLTGGASAVYGSDAVAGVVNFIMRKDFEGVEFDAQYSAYQHNNGNALQRGLVSAAGFAQAPSDWSGGEGFSGTMVMGVNSANGKGNITAYLGYDNTQQVLQSKFDYSACSTSAYSAAHAHDAYGRLIRDSLRCAGSANKALFYPLTGPGLGLGASGYYYQMPGGTLVPFGGSSYQYYNYGPVNTMQRPDTRYKGGAFAHYEVDKALDVYANFMFTDDHSAWQAAASALFFGAGKGPYGTQTFNCDNPLAAGTDLQTAACTAGMIASGADGITFVGRRNIEGGPRITDYRHTSYRMIVGAKGDLGDGWSYDISGMYSQSLYNQLYLHDLSASRTLDALHVDPITGQCSSGNDGCVPLDMFHGIGAITPDMLGYIYTHGQQTGYTEEQNIVGTLGGDLGQYGVKSPWAKNGVGISVGAEYRADYISRTTSDADQHGDLMGAGGADYGLPLAGYNVAEGFGELAIPVIENAPFAESLTLTTGYRYSSYSSAGSANSYEAKILWQPIDDFSVRANYQRATRAPNVLELFTPVSHGLGSFDDPCSGVAPSATAAQCANMGVTAAQYGSVLACPASQCNIIYGGNASLKPETAITQSIGVVLTPTFLDGFTATVDYWDVKVDQAIGSISANTIMTECLGGNLALCGLVHRNAQGFLFTNAGYVVQTNVNTGYLHERGIDIEANYATDLNDWGVSGAGSLAFHFVGSYVDEFLQQPYTGADSASPYTGVKYQNYDCAGLYGQSCGVPTPEWRHNLRVTWSSPWDFDLSVAWRHMSAVTFDGNSTNPYIATSSIATAGAGGAIDAYDYFDLAGSWTVSEGVQLRAGVNNLFDKNPPYLANGGLVSGPTGPENGNTFPGVYDPMGRYIFVGGSVKL